jgi:signal transduction histidine kinase
MRQFSAAVAHELRTPLAILRGEAELALRSSASDEARRQTLVRQIDEYDRLTRLINQILTLARAESGEITLAGDPIDLAALAASVTDQIEPVASAAGITVTCEGTGPVIVTGDAGWLERLLLILLDNAIKFTPSGGWITVTCARTDGTASVAVADSGPGIPSDALPHLFERFYRADPDRARDTQGAGLGLALAKWIADRHHATITVKSRVGEGARFAITFPVRTADRSSS